MNVPAVLLQVADVTEIQSFIQFVRWDRIWFALLVFVSVLVLQGLMKRTLNDLGERFTDRRLTFKKVGALGRFGLYFMAILLIGFSTLQLSSQALLGVATTLGVAFAFAFKDLLASLKSIANFIVSTNSDYINI